MAESAMLEIGRDAPGFVEYLNGALDDLRIYSRALSAAEVKALCDGMPVNPGVTYTVTFDLNSAEGDAPTERQVAEGAVIGTLPTPTREGYEFLGWHVGKEASSEEVTASTVVTGDLIVYAVWQLAEYTVTFDLNGADGTEPAPREVAYGSAIGTLPTPEREGYEFLGWFTSPNDWEGWQVDEWTEVYEDVTYYARWEMISYTVTFDLNSEDGVAPTEREIAYGEVIGALPVPMRTGYEFLGWFTAKTGGKQITASTVVDRDAIYYAQWRVLSYKVTFNMNGAEGAAPKSRNVTHGAAIGTLPTVARTGHTFLGWFTAASGGTQVYATDAVTAARTLYAHWQANTYTLTFNANGGDSSCSYRRTYGSQVGTLPAVSRSGYVFKGWFTAASGGTRVSASTTVTGNATYYARWATHAEELAVTLGTAYAEFSTDANAPWFPDGSAVRSGFISHNGSSTMSVRLYGSGLLSFRWKVSSEPEYDVLSYSVDGIQGGRVSGEQGWASASILVAGSGWHTVRFTYSKDDGSSYGSDCGWVDSLVWTGSAPPVTKFTITFNANGGTVGTASITRSQGAQLGTLPVPTRTGYTFLGWYTAASGGVQVYASTTVSANATYYARWQADSPGGGPTPPAPVVTYTVTFDGNGGSVDTPRVTRTAGTEIGSMPVPEAEGYAFLGWFTARTGGTQVTASTKVTTNVTYYARWQAVEDEYSLWDEDEAFDADAAATFDGFLTKNGEVRGTIQVKAGKASRAGVSKLSASVVLLGHSAKLSYKGVLGKPGAGGDFAPGVATLTCKGQPNLSLRVGRNALWGEMGAYEIEGSRNVFAKAGDPKAAALSRWQGAYTIVLETVDAEGAGSAFAWGYSGLTLTVGAKGKVKVQGTMVDGAKVSVTAQLLVGEKRCCIPVAVPLYSKKGGFGLNLWLQDDGEIETGELGAWDATASKAPFRAWFGENVPTARVGAALPSSLSFLFMGEPEFADAEALYEFVPWEVPISAGAKWTLPAAGSMKYDRESEGFVDTKESANPAGLKLTYVSKTGAFKGSFKLYAVDGAGRLKKLTANVSGVMVGRQGYGTATVKNVGSWPVSIQ